jgi:hypothetical protein
MIDFPIFLSVVLVVRNQSNELHSILTKAGRDPFADVGHISEAALLLIKP